MSLLAVEYAEAAERVERLAAQLAQATRERNAVVAAIDDVVPTRQGVGEVTGLAVHRVSHMVWAHWRDTNR